MKTSIFLICILTGLYWVLMTTVFVNKVLFPVIADSGFNTITVLWFILIVTIFQSLKSLIIIDKYINLLGRKQELIDQLTKARKDNQDA